MSMAERDHGIYQKPSNPFMLATVSIILCVAVWFRLYKLSVYPGINGDELFVPVTLWDWLHGSKVDWLTPSGHFLSPIYGLIALPFVVFWPAVDWAARAPAAILGISLLAAHFILGRKIFPYPVWLSGLILLTCFPLAISLSRIGWEPSATPLLVWLLLYFLVRGNLVLGLITFCLAVSNQVVCLLLFPAIVLRVLLNFNKMSKKARVFSILMASSLTGLIWVIYTKTSPVWNQNFQNIGKKFTDPAAILHSFTRTIKMIVGCTVFRGFSVGPGSEIPFSVEVLYPYLFISLLFLGFVISLWKKNVSALFYHSVFFISFIAFYSVSGPEMLGPGFERYPLFLMVPFSIAFSFSLQEIGNLIGSKFFIQGFLVAFGIFSLVVFFEYYFTPFDEYGGKAHWVYLTADEEPKVKAMKDVLGNLSKEGPKVIVTSCWYDYFFAKYFSETVKDVRILHLPSLEPNLGFQKAAIAPGKELAMRIRSGAVGLGSPEDGLNDFYRATLGPDLRTGTYCSKNGTPVIDVWRSKGGNEIPERSSP